METGRESWSDSARPVDCEGATDGGGVACEATESGGATGWGPEATGTLVGRGIDDASEGSPDCGTERER